MMSQYKINEIFYSLQGEGRNAGCPAIFIRFSGCNLQCPFCDTQHNDGQKMSADEILANVKQYAGKMIVLTGGEPSLFIDEDFVAKFLEAGYKVCIETNGTHALPKNLSWVTLSPKDQFVEKADIVLSECDELKLVFPCPNPQAYDGIKATYRYLQPCDTGDDVKNGEIIAQCIEYIKQNPQWTLSLQTHKILSIR